MKDDLLKDAETPVMVVNPESKNKPLTTRQNNENNVSRFVKDFTVYYQDGVDLYECFPDRSRRLINETLSRLIDKSRRFALPILVISDIQVGYLRHSLSVKEFHHMINHTTVEFHYEYGLISEEEYLQFKQTER